ncbi:hypothetical protein [Thermosporothrix hazakensis]|uniref:Uncharacterized protein n=1 Tax=Thermosporothrix sp. COM3 TaxID=2490863 RepID=A0A455SFB9_9CHLR|nr:hypothetical protein [Thermosporothrix hazakensis]BBH86200.1 hypothetical protein KTC_09510 [Thermosporothrix sp. COM3]GCE45378.1 hypothetical protein KTH_02470 [Thermosporothrix hazakensis]
MGRSAIFDTPFVRGFFFHPACLRIIVTRRHVAACRSEALDEFPSVVPAHENEHSMQMSFAEKLYARLLDK